MQVYFFIFNKTQEYYHLNKNHIVSSRTTENNPTEIGGNKTLAVHTYNLLKVNRLYKISKSFKVESVAEWKEK